MNKPQPNLNSGRADTSLQGKLALDPRISRYLQYLVCVILFIFSTVMQTLDFVSGLHNCLEFSQPLGCLYQDTQTQGKSFLLLL